ncbi:MAG: Hint domain-containing protein [Pseudomonadota bacterium]
MTRRTVHLGFDDLAPGTVVTDQYAARGVRIVSLDPDHPAMIFNARAPSGGDDDLAAPDLGHVLIASEDGDASDPDDNRSGAAFRFDFDDPVEVQSLTFLDVEAGATVTFFGPDGIAHESQSVGTGDGGQVEMSANMSDVGHMIVSIRGSGAMDNVVFVASAPRDGIVEGTEADDLIDIAYVDASDGDRIDSGDAILPGEADDDDIVLAGAGNDEVHAGRGDDEVFGGAGEDRLFGNGGADLILGEDGDDRLSGGGGDDVLNGGRGDDRVRGGRGDDRLLGGAGDDLLIGGAGADEIFGGQDRDRIIGGNGGDVVDGGSGGDDFDTLDLTGTGVRRIDYDPEDRESGVVTFEDETTLIFREIENVVPCFTPGTRLATRQGEVPVEQLTVGVHVITRDNGMQPIRWIGQRALSAAELRAAPHLRPIRIARGALGHGLPESDLIVSPQHRLLAASNDNLLYFETSEILVAARHLVGRPGITRMSARPVTYLHIMFDAHEVVLSNGAWSESFRPGLGAMAGLGTGPREELLRLFPHLAEPEAQAAYGAARRMARGREAALFWR